jgi:hypothetical protein
MATNTIDAEPAKHATREYRKHGLGTMKRAIKHLGSRSIDRRTSLGKALDQWRGQLISDLGGKADVSTQELAIIDVAVKTKLLLDSVDTWLLQQKTLINHRKRSIYPVVSQRQTLADALARYMGQLGLARRARPAPTIRDYLAGKGATGSTRAHDEGPTPVEEESPCLTEPTRPPTLNQEDSHAQ